jgi:hypothetical protein
MKVFCNECKWFKDVSSTLGDTYLCTHVQNRKYWDNEDTPIHRAYSKYSHGDCMKCNEHNDCTLFEKNNA